MTDQDSAPLSGPSFGPLDGGDPRQLVILLHGVGADGNDLIGLAPHWAQQLPGALFISPDGPEPYDMAPVGRQWFSLMNRAPEVVAAGIKSAAPVLTRFIDAALAQFGLDEGALALVGFSQGTMMALHVALNRDRPVAALLGYSGALAGPEAEAGAFRARPPVMLIHGDCDDVVPVERHFDAVEKLLAADVAVTAHVCPGLGHGIDNEGLGLGGAFLAAAFSNGNSPAAAAP